MAVVNSPIGPPVVLIKKLFASTDHMCMYKYMYMSIYLPENL